MNAVAVLLSLPVACADELFCLVKGGENANLKKKAHDKKSESLG